VDVGDVGAVGVGESGAVAGQVVLVLDDLGGEAGEVRGLGDELVAVVVAEVLGGGGVLGVGHAAAQVVEEGGGLGGGGARAQAVAVVVGEVDLLAGAGGLAGEVTGGVVEELLGGGVGVGDGLQAVEVVGGVAGGVAVAVDDLGEGAVGLVVSP